MTMLATALTWLDGWRHHGTSGGSQGDSDISDGGDRSLSDGWCVGLRYNNFRCVGNSCAMDCEWRRWYGHRYGQQEDCNGDGRFWWCSGCRSCNRDSDRGDCIIDCTRWEYRGHRYNECICGRRDFAIGWSGIDCGASRVLLYSAVAHFGCGNGFYQTAVSRRGCSVPGRHAKIGRCRRARNNQLQR